MQLWKKKKNNVSLMLLNIVHLIIYETFEYLCPKLLIYQTFSAFELEGGMQGIILFYKVILFKNEN